MMTETPLENLDSVQDARNQIETVFTVETHSSCSLALGSTISNTPSTFIRLGFVLINLVVAHLVIHVVFVYFVLAYLVFALFSEVLLISRSPLRFLVRSYFRSPNPLTPIPMCFCFEMFKPRLLQH